MFVPMSFVAFFIIFLIVIMCFNTYIYLRYRNTRMILKEYEDITRGYDELQKGIGKYRESNIPSSTSSFHYYVGASGSRNAANTYRR